MTIKNLDRLFHPRSIAVIGASNREGSVGNRVMVNLQQAGFKGPIMPVNPRYASVAGVISYPDIASLPLAPDLAIFCTPGQPIPELIKNLGERGTRAAVVMTQGLHRETTPAGNTLEQAMLEAAAPYALRILGPNALGLLVAGIQLNASFAHLPALPGRIAFVSQSGAMCTSVLDWARAQHIGFSHFISLGGGSDVNFADVIDYLGSDPGTRSILLYMESLEEGRHFMSAARAAARNKPMLVIKAGRSEAGARAIAAHAQVPAGDDAVYDAAIRRAGMLRVNDIEELFAGVETLARAGRMRGEKLAIISNGACLGIMAVDALGEHSDTLATLSEATLAQLDAVLPSPGPRGNPVDIFSSATGSRYRQVFSILAQAPEVNMILVIHAPVATSDSLEAAQGVIEAVNATPCSLLTCWVGEETAKPARQLFARENIPTYGTPTTAVRAFMHGIRYRQNQRLLMETPDALPREAAPDTDTARRLVDSALQAGARELPPAMARALLEAYGIAPLPDGAAANPDAYELYVGVTGDPTFGPVIRFGQGGRASELIDDRAIALPPLNTSLARDLISRTRVAQRLHSTADGPVVDRDALQQALIQVAQLIIDLPEVVELEINPLLADERGVRVRTARILVQPPGADAARRLAIRPYPKQLAERYRLEDGRELEIRPIRPEDTPNHYRLIDSASEQDLRYRFFGTLQKLRPSQMARLTQIDYDREMAFVAVTTGQAGDTEAPIETLGVVRTVTDPDNEYAEFAILLHPALKGSGLGQKLMEKMIDYCRSRGTGTIGGQILQDNARMLALAKKVGFTLTPIPEEEVVEVKRLLN